MPARRATGRPLAFGPMSTLSRYVLRQLQAPFVYALVALTGVMLLGQVAKQLGKLVGKGLPASVIGEVFLLSVPFIVAMTLPLAILTAVLWTTVRLGADSELIACYAVGISPRRLLRPVLLWAMAMSLVQFAFVDQVLPRSNARLRTLFGDIARKRPTLALREQAVNALTPSPYFLRAGRIEPATGSLRDVTLWDASGALVRRVVYADSGRMAFTRGGRDLALTLWVGEAHQLRGGPPEEFELTRFARGEIRVKDVFDELNRSKENGPRAERELGTCEMLATIDSAHDERIYHERSRGVLVRQDLRWALGLPDRLESPDSVPPGLNLPKYCALWAPWVRDTLAEARAAAAPSAGVVAPPTNYSTNRLTTIGEVLASQDGARNAQLRADRFDVEVHKKFALTIACLSFVLIGVPVAARFPRGGLGLVLGAGLAVYAIYFSGLSAGETLADRGIISPVIAMYGSNIVLVLMATVAMYLVRDGGGLPRGGAGFGDWVQHVTRRFRRTQTPIGRRR